MKILLDPGHGQGRAHNRGSLIGNEGDNNYKMALKLKRELEKYGVKVGLTRNSESDNPSLVTRGQMGKGYDLALSLHTNAANGIASGCEIWDDINPDYSNPELAKLLCITISELLKIPNRGVKYKRNSSGNNWYGFLENGYAKSNMIIEFCFHDNYSDINKYINNMDSLAAAVAETVANYYGLKKSKDPKKEFIQSILECKKSTNYRILPSVTIAQAALESNWGKSELAKNANNLFGIKASKDWEGAIYTKKTLEHDRDRKPYTITANFRKYDSIKDSVIDHDNFFVSTNWRIGNYKPVLDAKDYKEQAKALQKCGYATDWAYSNKLIDIIERYKLDKFDRVKKESKVSEWAAEAWDWATNENITDGTNPKKEATREEVITMLYRMKELMK